MIPLNLEMLAEEKTRIWEAKLSQRELLSQIPRRPPFWERWLGSGMVYVGHWLTSWGVWLVRREYFHGVTVAGNTFRRQRPEM